MTRIRLACGVASLLAAAAMMSSCSHDLTTSKAEAAIRATQGAEQMPISVSGISKDSDSESVALVTVDGNELHFRFRRYDTGWKWESVDGANGKLAAADFVAARAARIAAEVAAAAERERASRAKKWADNNRQPYVDTGYIFDKLRMNLARTPGEDLGIESWAKRHKLLQEMAKDAPGVADHRDLLLKHLPGPTDAWDRPIEFHFDGEHRTALYLSPGQDGIKNTPDDIVCLFTGSKRWDDFYKDLMWDYIPTCKIPEGLEGAISEWVRDAGGTVTATKAIQ